MAGSLKDFHLACISISDITSQIYEQMYKPSGAKNIYPNNVVRTRKIIARIYRLIGWFLYEMIRVMAPFINKCALPLKKRNKQTKNINHKTKKLMGLFEKRLETLPQGHSASALILWLWVWELTWMWKVNEKFQVLLSWLTLAHYSAALIWYKHCCCHCWINQVTSKSTVLLWP